MNVISRGIDGKRAMALTVIGAALIGLTLGGSVAIAQDASPVAGECAATTVEENEQIAANYFDRALALDFAAAEALLDDNFTKVATGDDVAVPNDPAEETPAEGTAPVYTVTVMFAEEDWVAVSYSYELSGADVEGADPAAAATVTGIALVRVECSLITEMLIESDGLTALIELGYEVGPPAGN